MKRTVNRTISITKASVKVIDVNTDEITTYERSYYSVADDKDLKKRVISDFSGYQVLKVTKIEEVDHLFRMDEDEFIRLAKDVTADNE